MKNDILILEKWDATRKWILVIAAFLLALGLCGKVSFSHGNLLSASMLLYVPVALAAVLLGIETAGVLAVVGLLYALVFLLPALDQDGFVFTAILAGLIVNGIYWYRYVRDGEIQDFQYQKLLDEVGESKNSIEADFEKSRMANVANQVKVQRYRALNELARNLAMVFKTNDVVILLIETISKTFMAPGGVYTLLLFESSIGKAMHAVRYSVDTDMEVRLNRERLNMDEPFNAWVISQSRALFTNDATNDFRFQSFASTERRIRSLIAAPLLAGSEVLGLIRIESPEPGVFRQDDARLLSNFADLVTVALEHAALYRQTIELAITDGLTGLYVQRYYKERVRDEVLRALEHKLPLCVMMMDVDNFKSYNDTFGHLVGDRVLKSIARVLRETVRAVDLVARYGGEEFSVLLPKTQWDGARIVADRIRKTVEELEIPVVDQITKVTISIGVAEINPSVKDADMFIDLADQALYQAKADGKNCVRLAKAGN